MDGTDPEEGRMEEKLSKEKRMVPDRVDTLADARFVKLYDLVYEDGVNGSGKPYHYFEASRRAPADLLATKPDEELVRTLPDATSICLILDVADDEPRIVMFHEFRYPTGQYVLAIPSGLIDERDLAQDDPLTSATVREIFEETGIRVREGDTIRVVNPLLFCTPGLTDESTALMCVVVRRKDREALAAELSQEGAEGSELFGAFELLSHDEAWQVIRDGRDMRGRFYPMVAWTALMWFATGQWME